MINVSNLNKYYHKGKSNEIHVINNTNLVLPNNGFVVFLGASGSGKTTLINVIAGLDKAKGEISYDEAKFKNYHMSKIDKFRRENVGYVFQNYNLLNNMTVFDNLRITLELMGINDSKMIKERIEYVLDMLNMKKYKNKLASNLSGGQMQRVSIARALVKDSKIIIADEPTGNLDSENTIEVMNILKAISKDKLVIMVTHDRKCAEFYADRIIEIKDGVVEKDYENTDNSDLDNYDNNKIYLKDMKNEVLDINNVKINLYLDENDSLSDLNLTIVKKDGVIYLKSDDVKVIDNKSKIKLIDDNYKSIKKEDVKSFNYNPTPIEKTKKKFSLMPLLRGIANAYSSHKQASKKMKGLHACFVIIGVVMAFCVLMLSVGTYVNGKQIEYSDKGLQIVKLSNANYKDCVKTAVNDGLIEDVSFSELIYFNNSIESTIVNTETYLLHESYNTHSLIAGEKNVSGNEVLITKKIADQIIKKFKNIEKYTYKNIIGRTISFDNRNSVNFVIKGITDSESSNLYTSFYNSGSYFPIGYYARNSYANYNYIIENKNKIGYEIVSGREIASDNECLVCINDAVVYTEDFSSTITLGDSDADKFEVVGYYRITESITYGAEPNVLLNNQDLVKKYYAFNAVLYHDQNLNANDLKLVSGRLPESNNEILISDCIDLTLETSFIREINDYIKEKGLTVVGVYESKANNRATAFGCTKNYILENYLTSAGNGAYLFITNDDNKLIDLFKDNGIQLKTSYNANHDFRVQQKREMFGSALTVSGVFLVIIVVYVFFMMRSKMIHRIYEIGVLREIGASRFRIYRIFFIELMVLITMTTIIGYTTSLILCHLANKKIGGLLGLFNYSPLYATLGFVVIYGVSIIAGMLPIFMLQRKTPAEIVAKYDL